MNSIPLLDANRYHVGNDVFIKLLPIEKVKKLPTGTKLVSVVGKEIEVGKDQLDLETTVFKCSKYGEPIAHSIAKTGTSKSPKKKS